MDPRGVRGSIIRHMDGNVQISHQSTHDGPQGGPWQYQSPHGQQRPDQQPGQRTLRNQPEETLTRGQLYVELCKRPVRLNKNFLE